MADLKNKKLKITYLILILLVTAVSITVLTFPKLKSEHNTLNLNNKLLRFHVIANSDSEEDQALKRRIRDKIIREMAENFKDVKSIEQSKQLVRENIKQIEEIAREEITNSGKTYEVKAELGNFAFPTKNYGTISLPAGEYEALRVVIGEGGGANWWCVLFPPLCFVDITQGLTSEKTKTQLNRVLTEEEINRILNTENREDISIEVRFKLAEMIKGVTAKMAGR